MQFNNRKVRVTRLRQKTGSGGWSNTSSKIATVLLLSALWKKRGSFKTYSRCLMISFEVNLFLKLILWGPKSTKESNPNPWILNTSLERCFSSFASNLGSFNHAYSAYTTAINTGRVPNIQNAWSYVCQNECQRAIAESVATYDADMRKVLHNAKLECDEDILKREHRPLREAAIATFKQKAVG